MAKLSAKKHSRETCFQKHFLQVTTVCGLPKQVQAQLGPSPTQEKHAPTSFLPLLHNYLTVSNLPSATNFTTPLLHTTTQGSRTSNKRVGKITCTSQQNCKDNQRLSRSFTPPLGRAVSEPQSPELCLALSDKIRTHRDCIQHAYAFRHKENI